MGPGLGENDHTAVVWGWSIAVPKVLARRTGFELVSCFELSCFHFELVSASPPFFYYSPSLISPNVGFYGNSRFAVMCKGVDHG